MTIEIRRGETLLEEVEESPFLLTEALKRLGVDAGRSRVLTALRQIKLTPDSFGLLYDREKDIWLWRRTRTNGIP